MRKFVVGGALATLLMAPAHADDQPFVTLVTTDIQPEHGREIEQWLIWKSGRPGVSANEFVSRTELEYGFTDNLQGALYLNNVWERERIAPGPAAVSDFAGVSGELVWRLMNPYFDPVGLALYVEPTWAPNEHAIETKILVHKNFLDHRLRTVLNVIFEDVWARNTTGGFDRSSALEIGLGASYNMTPDFSVGLEFNNEREFDGLIVGTSSAQTVSAYYLGPTIQYVGHPWAITFGAQAQLPTATSSVPGAVIGGYAAEAENFRMTLRVSTDI